MISRPHNNNFDELVKTVIPAQAGIQVRRNQLIPSQLDGTPLTRE